MKFTSFFLVNGEVSPATFDSLYERIAEAEQLGWEVETLHPMVTAPGQVLIIGVLKKDPVENEAI